MQISEMDYVTNPQNPNSEFQSPISNSDLHPPPSDSDQTARCALLHQILHKTLSLNADDHHEEKEGNAEQVNIFNQKERGYADEESNGVIGDTVNVAKVEYDWLAADEREIKQTVYEEKAEYDWLADEHVTKETEYQQKAEYDWLAADELEIKETGYEGKAEYDWLADDKPVMKETEWLAEDDHQVKDQRYYNHSNYGGSSYDNAGNSAFPLRPEAEDCAYYVKTGDCKFGFSCKFNHPVRWKKQATQVKVVERRDLTEDPGQIECKYYTRTDGCKFGSSCRYSHSKRPVSGVQTQDLNFLGLPIRPGEIDCSYYMRNGSCKYEANCRFNHPDPTASGESDPTSGPGPYGNGRSPTSQSNITEQPWSSTRPINATAPYAPMMFSQAQVAPPQSPKWNGYQAPPYPPERGLHLPPPAYGRNNSATETVFYGHDQHQMLFDQFPERPGQPECSYYLKYGDCKFKMNCKYHHPKSLPSKSIPCALSDKGLPLRPGQNICTHYSRYGICKFGPACRYDHPIQPSSSMDDNTHLYGKPVPKGSNFVV